MKTLNFRIYKLFPSNLFTIFLLAMFLAVCAVGQGTGDSVFIINQTTTNNEAGVIADYLGGEIAEGIQDKFPCVDYSSPEDVKAVLDAARDKELLTGELSQEQLANIAGSIGARYIVLVSVIVLPNGQTVVTARLLDTKTGRTITNESETAANAEAAFANAESLANKLMQAFSKIFKNKCEPHWTGTITYTQRIQTASKTEKAGATSQSSETRSKNSSGAVNIVLQPMTLGFSGRSSAQARITQNYSYIEKQSSQQTTEIGCREPGRNTYKIKITTDFNKTTTENGSGAQVETVFIRFYDDGRYSIYTMSSKPIKTTVRVETNGNEVKGCSTVPFSTARENEDAKNLVFIDLQGQVDPKNPDLLTGKKVEGDLETGQKTWEWKLRLVRPDRKKAVK